ncbi:hypothetical protein ACFQL7_28575 [Halocatena marina]|uniref:Uncharacterized protein n=1 Tax=Halocatena marina TaxID=2934937 RepID=A0ABD5YVT7_9EURY
MPNIDSTTRFPVFRHFDGLDVHPCKALFFEVSRPNGSDDA